jgi:hypothetical protein
LIDLPVFLHRKPQNYHNRSRIITTTMMEEHLKYFLLCCLLSPAIAWVPTLEPLQVGYGMATALKATDRDHEDWDGMEQFHTLHYEDTDTHVDGEPLRSRIFISQPLLWEPSTLDDIYPTFDDLEAPCGEDCDECLIPEEYKIVANEEAVDVMAFLGIRRAEPLQVTRLALDWD